MDIGIVGLGRMGAGLARRLARGGARVVCHDHAEAAQKALAGERNLEGAENLAAHRALGDAIVAAVEAP